MLRARHIGLDWREVEGGGEGVKEEQGRDRAGRREEAIVGARERPKEWVRVGAGIYQGNDKERGQGMRQGLEQGRGRIGAG